MNQLNSKSTGRATASSHRLFGGRGDLERAWAQTKRQTELGVLVEDDVVPLTVLVGKGQVTAPRCLVVSAGAGGQSGAEGCSGRLPEAQKRERGFQIDVARGSLKADLDRVRGHLVVAVGVVVDTAVVDCRVHFGCEREGGTHAKSEPTANGNPFGNCSRTSNRSPEYFSRIFHGLFDEVSSFSRHFEADELSPCCSAGPTCLTTLHLHSRQTRTLSKDSLKTTPAPSATMPFGFGGGSDSEDEKKKKVEARKEAEALEAKKKAQAARRQRLGKKEGDPDTDEEEEGKKPGGKRTTT